MKRILFFALLTGVLAANTGCGLFHPCYYGNRGSGSLYYNTGDGGCGESGCATPRCASCVPNRSVIANCNDGGYCGGGGCSRSPYGGRSAGGDCDSCSSGGECDSCSTPCGVGCSNRPWHQGPLSCAFAYLGRLFWYCPGCGERYWGDFYDNPPDCHDQCGDCNNYADGGSASCSSCGYRGQMQRYRNGNSGDYIEGDVEEVPQGAVISQPGTVSPTPAPTSTLKPAVEPRRVKPTTNGGY